MGVPLWMDSVTAMNNTRLKIASLRKPINFPFTEQAQVYLINMVFRNHLIITKERSSYSEKGLFRPREEPVNDCVVHHPREVAASSNKEVAEKQLTFTILNQVD